MLRLMFDRFRSRNTEEYSYSRENAGIREVKCQDPHISGLCIPK